MYTFKRLIGDLKIGREIEFIYKGFEYSISNNPEGWQFCKDESALIDRAEDVEVIVEFICNYKFAYNYTLKEIINNSLYEENSLYIF